MIVIDTHIWLWYINNRDDLSKIALDTINRAKEKSAVFISCISTWEIFMLVSKGRLSLTIPVETWISKCEKLSFLHFIPVDNDISCLAANLKEPLHDDPADRIIIATAISKGFSLITKDKKLQNYLHIDTLY